MKKILTLALACVLIVAVLLSCSRLRDLVKPEDTSDVPSVQSGQEAEAEPSGEDARVDEIRQLEQRMRTACNEQDVEGILDCIDPSYANPLRTTMKVMGEDQVFSLLCQLLGADGSADPKEVCRSLDTELSNIEVTGDEAAADLHYTYEQDGKLYGADVDVEFRSIDGRWYVSSMKGK